MSEFMADLGGVLGTRTVGNKEIEIKRKGSNLELDMTDFVTLMITQLTNQGIDDTMDTSEMLNQMVQMQMVTSMVNMTDATMMSYSASLVGKEVTVGKYGDDGKLQEIVGTVTGTGTMDGQQVVFVNDEYYYLNEIMAIGRLPEQKEEADDEAEGVGGSGDKTEEASKPSGSGTTAEKPGETEKPAETPSEVEKPVETPGDAGKPAETESPSEAEPPAEATNPEETVQPGGEAETPVYSGENGAPQESEE